MTTTHTPNPNITILPDVGRRRPIEALAQASESDVCFAYILDVVDCRTPHETPSIEVLIEALGAVKADDHSIHLKSSINAILLDEDLRAAVWLALALKGLPGAASEVAQAYAKLARDFGEILQYVPFDDIVARCRLAETYCLGWCLVAAGVEAPPDVSDRFGTAAALALGHQVGSARYARKAGGVR